MTRARAVGPSSRTSGTGAHGHCLHPNAVARSRTARTHGPTDRIYGTVTFRVSTPFSPPLNLPSNDRLCWPADNGSRTRLERSSTALPHQHPERHKVKMLSCDRHAVCRASDSCGSASRMIGPSPRVDGPRVSARLRGWISLSAIDERDRAGRRTHVPYRSAAAFDHSPRAASPAGGHALRGSSSSHCVARRAGRALPALVKIGKKKGAQGARRWLNL